MVQLVFIYAFGLACAWDGYLVGSHQAAWLIVLTTAWTIPVAGVNIYLARDA